MSFKRDRKRTPPLTELQLLVLNVSAKAETVGARRALALAVKSGKYDDGRPLKAHWAALAEGREEYSRALAELNKHLADLGIDRSAKTH